MVRARSKVQTVQVMITAPLINYQTTQILITEHFVKRVGLGDS